MGKRGIVEVEGQYRLHISWLVGELGDRLENKTRTHCSGKSGSAGLELAYFPRLGYRHVYVKMKD